MKFRALEASVTIGVCIFNLLPEEEDFEDHTPNIKRCGVNNRPTIRTESVKLHEVMVSRDGGFVRDDPLLAVIILVNASSLVNIEAIREQKPVAGSLLKPVWSPDAYLSDAEMVNGSHRQDILRQLNFELLERRTVVAEHIKRLRRLEQSGVIHDKQVADTAQYTQEMHELHERLEDRTTFPAKLLDIGNLISR